VPRTSAKPSSFEEELESNRRRIRLLESQLAEQQDIQRKLEEDHRFREAVIEHAAEGVCVCQDVPAEPFVRFTVWNRRMVEITGYQMTEINQLGWYQTLYPDPEVQRQARERMERMRQGDNLCFERWEITRANGAKRAIAISTSVLTAADGSVHVLGLMHDLSEEEELARQRVLARTDPLTSLRNRRSFEEDAGLLLRLARRQKQGVAVGYLDLLGFKSHNDERGHLEGDRALQATAETLARALRSSDVVGRIGGDEFAILLPGTDAAGARVLFDGLLRWLLGMTKAHGWAFGFSLGVVLCADPVPELSEALRDADAAMYRAKKSGTSAIVFA
jgi:diguanylate cyclase (GGDEF)-like protein/PAS domain S-box-containing protein